MRDKYLNSRIKTLIGHYLAIYLRAYLARLSAFQAAWQRVSVSLCSRVAEILMVSVPNWDIVNSAGATECDGLRRWRR